MHYDGNEDKVEADSTIFQYYTLFSFFSCGRRLGQRSRREKNPTKKERQALCDTALQRWKGFVSSYV